MTFFTVDDPTQVIYFFPQFEWEKKHTSKKMLTLKPALT